MQPSSTPPNRSASASGTTDAAGRAGVDASQALAASGDLPRLPRDTTTRHRTCRLFVAYSPGDGLELPLRLAEDLADAGHEVWLAQAQHRERPGWEMQLEKAIDAHDVFLLLLTPRAVARPGGDCLGQIEYARSRSKRLVFCTVEVCQTPVGTIVEDWFEFESWRRPDAYRRALAGLLAALESPHAAVPYSPLRRRLEPFDFSGLLARLTPEFYGRDWAFGRVRHWLTTSRRRVMMITGEAGLGKTAFLAQVALREPRAVAFHCCTALAYESLDARRFVKSLAWQLSSQLPEYRNLLGTVDLESAEEESASALFRRLIAQPLSQVAGRQVLVLIAGWDTRAGNGERSAVASLLDAVIVELPDWVRWLLTSRERPRELTWLGEIEPCEFSATDAKSRGDAAGFVGQRLRSGANAEASACDDSTIEAFVARARANFLYARCFLDAYRLGLVTLTPLEAMPDGLSNLYGSLWRSLEPQESTERALALGLLEVVCAAREPLSFEFLAQALHVAASELTRVQERMKILCPAAEGTITPCHESLVEWAEVDDTPPDLRRGHAALARALQSGSDTRGRMACLHLPYHWTRAECWDQLVDLLCDLDFIASKLSRSQQQSLREDYRSALLRLPEMREQVTRRGSDAQRVEEYLGDLVLRASDPQHPFEAPRAVRIWTSDEAASLAQRSLANPSRVDRLTAFERFVAEQGNEHLPATEFEGFLRRQALAASAQSPVAEAARQGARRAAATRDLASGLLRLVALPPYNPLPAAKGCIRIDEEIATAVFTPDARYGVVAGASHRLHLWDLERGIELRTFVGHRSRVCALSVTPLGRTLASASRDGEVRVWDQKLGVCLKLLHADAPIGLALAADGRRLLLATGAGLLGIWRHPQTESLERVGQATAPLRALAATPDLAWVVSADDRGTVQLWGTRTPREPVTLVEHEAPVLALAMTPDASMVVAGTLDGTVLVWRRPDGSPIPSASRQPNTERAIFTTALKGHAGPVQALSLTPRGHYLLSTGQDRTLRVWDLVTGDCLQVLTGHHGSVTAGCLSPDARLAASASGLQFGDSDRSLRLWDLGAGFARAVPDHHRARVTHLELAVSGDYAASGARDGQVCLWDAERGACQHVLAAHHGAITALLILPENRVVVSAGSDGQLKVWRSARGDLLHLLQGHSSRIIGLCRLQNPRLIVSASVDGALCVWDVKAGRLVSSFGERGRRVSILKHIPDSNLVVTAGNGADVCLWDLSGEPRVQLLQGHGDEVLALAASCDGRVLASGGWDESLYLWDVRTGTAIKRLRGHTARIESVDISQDRLWMASADCDGHARLWAVQTGECVALLPGRVTTFLGSSELLTADGRGRMWRFGQPHWRKLQAFEAEASVIAAARTMVGMGTTHGSVFWARYEP